MTGIANNSADSGLQFPLSTLSMYLVPLAKIVASEQLVAGYTADAERTDPGCTVAGRIRAVNNHTEVAETADYIAEVVQTGLVHERNWKTT